MSIFSAPWGYLVSTASTVTGRSAGRRSRRRATASGLLSSTPITARSAPVARRAMRMPAMMLSGRSSIRRWSQVR